VVMKESLAAGGCPGSGSRPPTAISQTPICQGWFPGFGAAVSDLLGAFPGLHPVGPVETKSSATVAGAAPALDRLPNYLLGESPRSALNANTTTRDRLESKKQNSERHSEKLEEVSARTRRDGH
jgi:hypothetical protein